jgi:hypothetical protein
MTLALMQESRAMKQLPDYMQEPDRPRSLDELRCRLNRRLSNMRKSWKRCDNGLCRRWKQCCGEGPEFKCTDDGRPRRTPTPEEEAKVSSDLYKALKKRRAELAVGAKPTEPGTPQRDAPRAVTRRKRKPAKTAAPAPQLHRDEPRTSVVEETPLAPEQQERIAPAWNDDVASQPAEQGSARERRPRITQL